MPRPVVLGNGEILVCEDYALNIRDFYFPYVGLYNHLSGHKIRMGVWSNGRFSWLDSGEWAITLDYLPGTLVTQCAAVHSGMSLSLSVNDCVSYRANIFLRRICLRNLADFPREVRVFLSHNFHLAETDIGDTAFYNPYLRAVIHYKRDTWFLATGTSRYNGIYQYACGVKGFGGAEGTWRDCEDGELSGRPIEQGSVDSSISFRLLLAPGDEEELRYWIAVGHDYQQVRALHSEVVETGFEEIMRDTANYWVQWSEKGAELVQTLPEPIAKLFRRSLLIIRTQIDDRGAVIAANDTDIMSTARAHYSYMWPRDGAIVAYALDTIGYPDTTRRFFEFCARVLPKDRPVLMHKYSADGSVGSSWHPWVVDEQPEMPFQEDSTASVLWALWHHYQRYHDLEFIASLYETLIVPAGRFLATYRDPQTGLPLPSYDLWEERRGIHTYTCASVYAALRSAARFAHLFGDNEEHELFRRSAEEVKAGILHVLYDEDTGCFARMMRLDAEGNYHRDTTVDSSVLGVLRFGVLDADSPQMQRCARHVREKLWVNTPIGGLARYENDYYHRKSHDVPGNPWIICTMWLAEYEIERAGSPADLRPAMDLIEWATQRALPTGVLPEQVDPFTGEPLSVAPLTWSHAEYVYVVMAYLRRLRGMVE
ncbi:MAG: glycoside hydrolase family 15 protein [Armatimonadota bacterium]